jgi:hypothetical protein
MRAQQISCLNNEKQMGIGGQMYADVYFVAGESASGNRTTTVVSPPDSERI